MTHQAPGDVPILCTLPGMEVVVAGTPGEFDALFRESYADGAPTYFRLHAQQNEADRPVRFGRLHVEREGSRATVVAVGPMLDRTLEAADGLDVGILYCTTVAPFDRDTLRAVAGGALGNAVIVVEPYYEGTLVPEIVRSLSPASVRIEAVGIPRRVLSGYGGPEEHDAHLGLTADGIRGRLEAFLAAAPRA
jgi:transketolase